MYLLDTNTLIYYFKGLGKVTDNLLRQSPQDIGIPSIVLFELQVGIAKSTNPDKRLKQLAMMMNLIKVIPFAEKEASSSAMIRARLESEGQPIGYYDTLIAGTALANHSTLVTRNLKEFQRVDGLNIVDWY